MALIPVVTIITPVYNGEKFLAETIDSVINASISIPYEFLVLNDGSLDSTMEILESYGNKIRTISHKNIGESATVNRGIESAMGKYLLVLSADDPLLTAELLEIGVEILESDPTIVALYPDWKIIDEQGRTLKIVTLPEYSDEEMIGHSRCLPGPGVLFSKSAAMSIGGRREKWKYVGDYDFWLRLSRVGRIQRLPRVLAQWRQNSGSTSVSQRGQDMANNRIQVIEEFISEFKISEDLSRMALGNAYYFAARLAFFDPRIKGRLLLTKALIKRHGWPEEAQFLVVVFLLLLPFSALLLKLSPRLISKIVKSYS